MIDQSHMLPEDVRERVRREVTGQIGAENHRLIRAVAVRVLLTLALVSYVLITLDTVEDEPEFFALMFASVTALAGLVAADASLRIPQLFAGAVARRQPFAIPADPSRWLKWATVGASATLWVLPLSAGTGTFLSGVALAVALLPVLFFVSNVVLRASLAQWVGLPARVTMDLVSGRDGDADPRTGA